MKEIELKDEEYWYTVIKEDRKTLRELVLEDEKLISKEKLLKRLDDREIRVYMDESGTRHYEDKTLEQRMKESEDGSVTAKTGKLPIVQAMLLVETGKHPDELKSIKEKAEQMAQIDEAVTPVFRKQAKDGDFPLHYPPGEEE